MEFVGVVALLLVLMYSGLPGKVKKLSTRIKRLESKKASGGEVSMSSILKELEGKKCTLILESDFSPKLVCTVQRVEEEWIKVVEITKKGQENTKLLKIENIKEVTDID